MTRSCVQVNGFFDDVTGVELDIEDFRKRARQEGMSWLQRKASLQDNASVGIKDIQFQAQHNPMD